ncbi:MAG: hypothetical protein ABI311_03960 [Gemmatimonadaceae bacterium]
MPLGPNVVRLSLPSTVQAPGEAEALKEQKTQPPWALTSMPGLLPELVPELVPGQGLRLEPAQHVVLSAAVEQQ